MLLDYIPTEEKDDDLLIKALSRCKFEFHIDRVGVVDNPFLVEMECWEKATRNSSLICPWIKLRIKIELYSHNNL